MTQTHNSTPGQELKRDVQTGTCVLQLPLQCARDGRNCGFIAGAPEGKGPALLTTPHTLMPPQCAV